MRPAWLGRLTTLTIFTIDKGELFLLSHFEQLRGDISSPMGDQGDRFTIGRKDLETMQIYIRLAGIEVQGVTEGLKLLPETEIMGQVVDLFGSNH